MLEFKNVHAALISSMLVAILVAILLVNKQKLTVFLWCNMQYCLHLCLLDSSLLLPHLCWCIAA